MLKNISVRAKLFVLLILPVAALIALAAGNALEKYQTVRAMAMAGKRGGPFLGGQRP